MEKRGGCRAPPLFSIPCLHCPSAWRAVCTAPVSALRQRPLLCPQCRCIVVQHGAACGVVCRAHGEGEAPTGSARLGVPGASGARTRMRGGLRGSSRGAARRRRRRRCTRRRQRDSHCTQCAPLGQCAPHCSSAPPAATVRPPAAAVQAPTTGQGGSDRPRNRDDGDSGGPQGDNDRSDGAAYGEKRGAFRAPPAFLHTSPPNNAARPPHRRRRARANAPAHARTCGSPNGWSSGFAADQRRTSAIRR